MQIKHLMDSYGKLKKRSLPLNCTC